MLATVGRGRHFGLAGFAVKSCGQRSRSTQTVFCKKNLELRAPCDDPCRFNDAALVQQIEVTLSTMYIESETGTRLAQAEPRKQKSQQALTC